MPTVLKIGAWRFFFYSLENDEPAHIHVEQGSASAKFWLDPITRLIARLSIARPDANSCYGS